MYIVYTYNILCIIYTYKYQTYLFTYFSDTLNEKLMTKNFFFCFFGLDYLMNIEAAGRKKRNGKGPHV